MKNAGEIKKNIQIVVKSLRKLHENDFQIVPKSSNSAKIFKKLKSTMVITG